MISFLLHPPIQCRLGPLSSSSHKFPYQEARGVAARPLFLQWLCARGSWTPLDAPMPHPLRPPGPRDDALPSAALPLLINSPSPRLLVPVTGCPSRKCRTNWSNGAYNSVPVCGARDACLAWVHPRPVHRVCCCFRDAANPLGGTACPSFCPGISDSPGCVVKRSTTTSLSFQGIRLGALRH